jgi:hypothetical protein
MAKIVLIDSKLKVDKMNTGYETSNQDQQAISFYQYLKVETNKTVSLQPNTSKLAESNTGNDSSTVINSTNRSSSRQSTNYNNAVVTENTTSAENRKTSAKSTKSVKSVKGVTEFSNLNDIKQPQTPTRYEPMLNNSNALSNQVGSTRAESRNSAKNYQNTNTSILPSNKYDGTRAPIREPQRMQRAKSNQKNDDQKR